MKRIRIDITVEVGDGWQTFEFSIPASTVIEELVGQVIIDSTCKLNYFGYDQTRYTD